MPPPGAGLITDTWTGPAVAISAADIAAVSVVLLTNEVGLDWLLSCATEVWTKLDPVMVSVKLPVPAVMVLGEIAPKTGIGFWTRKLRGDDAPPPGAGVKTVTAEVPTKAISLVEMVAVNEVELLTVVGRAAPFQRRTVTPGTKFVPVADSENAGPPTNV